MTDDAAFANRIASATAEHVLGPWEVLADYTWARPVLRWQGVARNQATLLWCVLQANRVGAVTGGRPRVTGWTGTVRSPAGRATEQQVFDHPTWASRPASPPPSPPPRATAWCDTVAARLGWWVPRGDR